MTTQITEVPVREHLGFETPFDVNTLSKEVKARCDAIEAGISTASSAYANEFVYKQGGTTGGKVYDTFLGAVTAAAAAVLIGALAAVVVDNSISSACVTGNCGAIDLTNIDLIGMVNHGTAVSLTFQTGTTVIGWRQIRNRLILKSTSTAPISVVTTATFPQLVFREQSGLQPASNGQPFFKVSAGSSFPAWFLMDGSSILNNGGTGNNAISVDAGQSAAINIFGGPAIVQNFAFGGAGTGYLISYNSSATIPASFPDIVVGNIFLLDTASGMSFTDAAPLLVPVPAVAGYPKVSEAIAGLKAKSTLLSGATGARPATNRVVGQAYFDTTLGLPIWWNGAAWVNAAAGVV